MYLYSLQIKGDSNNNKMYATAVPLFLPSYQLCVCVYIYIYIYIYISFCFGNIVAAVCMYAVDMILYYFVTFFNIKLLH
jgi:hypothetical protein